MKKTLIWIIPYFLSYVIHALWIFGGLFLAEHVVGIKGFWLQCAAVFVGWVVVVILSAGCPLTYLHEWLEIRAGWREKITYRFEDSILYKVFIRPFRA